MIPIHLRVSGFLSYRNAAELDFTAFDLACISGQNGAGKSSLLDAMTWCLFGEARGKGADVIHSSAEVKAAEVTLTFQHEGNIYRVQRTLPRNKSTVLEFQIRHGDEWRPLTEKTTRDTQARIEQTLRLDYETFVNASFFLQGKADQFTQQNAARRKEILSAILGLDVWEEYKNRAAERRKLIEREADEIEGRITEIDAELREENARRASLAELENNLDRLSSVRAAQEAVLENIRRNVALLNEQRKLASSLLTGLDRSRAALAGLESRLASRQADLASYLDLLSRAAEIERMYENWRRVRGELELWERTASRFRDRERERTPLLERVAAEKARLEEERRRLRLEEEELGNQSSMIEELTRNMAAAKIALKEAEERIAGRAVLESKRTEARERQAALKAENAALKTEMNRLRERIDALRSAVGATCPLCGQELSETHRASTLARLEFEGGKMGDTYRANLDEAKSLAEEVVSYELQIAGLSSAETDRIRLAGEVSQLAERLERLRLLAQDWNDKGRRRLREVEEALENGLYAAEAQEQLAKLNRELTELGYDAVAHDKAREEEAALRPMEEEYGSLTSAREASRQIEDEIASLRDEYEKRRAEIATQQNEYDAALSALKEAETNAPNLEDAERELFRLREEENKVRSELGGAKQRVEILEALRVRKTKLQKEREGFLLQSARYRALERAFGKDGVPALLIEQALPQIEEKANDLLDRLSGGGMSIRFVTQTGYKDKKRADMKETLEIQIGDAAGVRSYEMYSGGEAFRVNFALRLALSEILARRKGARLQTLVIDEGFGSQDAQGRQRLIEAVNLVKSDFAKILVVTHLDDLKDAFPTRIEVEKTEAGSMIRVV
ncbi:MAG: SMC family ATPase [Chloroflexi bacterium]|nr:SMC family ATPase [Chloroflexota bacterium]